MIRLKVFDEMLEVILTSEEKNERAAKMSATVIERRRLKEEMKRQSESFNSKIKLLDQEIEAEAVGIENGIEWRKVLCAERISANGIEVDVVRTDTGEVVRMRAMSEDERQEELFPEPSQNPPDCGDDQALAENMANAATFLNLGNEEADEWSEVASEFADECEREIEEQRAIGEEFVSARAEWLSGLSEDERQTLHGAPCVCGHWRGLHEEEGNGRCPAIAPGCKCKAYRCAECDTKGGHQASCAHYVTGEGTPIETELSAEEIERIADMCNAAKMDKIDKGEPLKIAYVNGGPYVVNGWVSGGSGKGRTVVWAYAVLPLATVGEGNARTRAEAYQEYEATRLNSPLPMSYLNVKFNGGSKKNPDWWVIVGEQVVFTVRPDGSAPEPESDYAARGANEFGVYLNPKTAMIFQSGKDYLKIETYQDGVDGRWRASKEMKYGDSFASSPCSVGNAMAFTEENAIECEVIQALNYLTRAKESGKDKAEVSRIGKLIEVIKMRTATKVPPVVDEFTASRCEECGRIDGAHDPQCVHASKFTYKTYLEFATAQGLKNPASHARKMELSRSSARQE